MPGTASLSRHRHWSTVYSFLCFTKDNPPYTSWHIMYWKLYRTRLNDGGLWSRALICSSVFFFDSSHMPPPPPVLYELIPTNILLTYYTHIMFGAECGNDSWPTGWVYAVTTLGGGQMESKNIFFLSTENLDGGYLSGNTRSAGHRRNNRKRYCRGHEPKRKNKYWKASLWNQTLHT